MLHAVNVPWWLYPNNHSWEDIIIRYHNTTDQDAKFSELTFFLTLVEMEYDAAYNLQIVFGGPIVPRTCLYSK